MAVYIYERDPQAIYRQSFARIAAEAPMAGRPPAVARLATRLIHSCGMTDILDELAIDPALPDAVGAAFAAGATLVCDSQMTAAGILNQRLAPGVELIAALALPGTAERAAEIGNTRSAAAMDLAAERIDGGVVAIGNAPTALFRLLELIEMQGIRPAAILAFPVGFVGAAESKEALIEAGLGIPYATLRGRRGGSAMAAAAVNVLILPEGEAL